MKNENYDIVIIGGGPAGIASAYAAKKHFNHVLIIERKDRLGGILEQCIHDGFGISRYNEELSGPEYARKEIAKLDNIDVALNANVYAITKDGEQIKLSYYAPDGVHHIVTQKLIIATGCRERSAKEITILGTNPSGVYTAGEAQYYINIMGKLPGKRVVILGSGDIGLIMARRLTLEGAKVIGVFEIKNCPSGLERNIVQCLKDYDIPLHLSTTVSSVKGRKKLTSVTTVKVDENMKHIEGSEEEIECDALIISAGLIPVNDMMKKLGLKMSPRTKGPIVDEHYMSSVPNVYCVGNALHVHNLVDDVSYTGERAASFAKDNLKERELIDVTFDEHISYVVPEVFDIKNIPPLVDFALRVKEEMKNITLKIYADEEVVFQRKYVKLLPPEMLLVKAKMKDDMKMKKIHLAIEKEDK